MCTLAYFLPDANFCWVNLNDDTEKFNYLLLSLDRHSRYRKRQTYHSYLSRFILKKFIATEAMFCQLALWRIDFDPLFVNQFAHSFWIIVVGFLFSFDYYRFYDPTYPLSIQVLLFSEDFYVDFQQFKPLKIISDYFT